MPDKPRKAAAKLMRNDTCSDVNFSRVYSTGPAKDREIGGFHGNHPKEKKNPYTKRGASCEEQRGLAAVGGG